MPQININTNGNKKTFVELTRAYRVNEGKVNEAVRTQPITVAIEDIVEVRPSNTLGKEYHRSTITLSNGLERNLSQRYSEVKNLLPDFMDEYVGSGDVYDW